jgi:transposase
MPSSPVKMKAASPGAASLIETCKINGIEPFAYLKATLTAIAHGQPQSRLDDLLPWNFKPSS